MNTYIIPSIGRETIKRTISSIEDEDPTAEILVCKGGTASENRNLGLEVVNGEWIFFIDDDDFYSPGYLSEIDDSLDIVVFRMLQHGRVIPRYEDERLVERNVGINFAIKKSFYEKLNLKFINLPIAEDWEFLKHYLQINPKVKITKDIYYNAPVANHLS